LCADQSTWQDHFKRVIKNGVVFFIGKTMNTDIKESILKDTRVSRSEILIVLFLSQNEGIWCHGQRTLALELGLSRQTVHKSIKDLELYGYLEKENSLIGTCKIIILNK